MSSGCVRADHQGLEKRHDKQPANLAVEGAGEFLSILPDYTPTVRPRPSAVDHLQRDMLQRLTCSRTATVVCGVGRTAHRSGSLHTHCNPQVTK